MEHTYGEESKNTMDGNEGKSTKDEALTMVKQEKAVQMEQCLW